MNPSSRALPERLPIRSRSRVGLSPSRTGSGRVGTPVTVAAQGGAAGVRRLGTGSLTTR